MIWWLHGFLGRADDWRPFFPLFADTEEEMRAPCLFEAPMEPLSIESWARQFVDGVRAQDDHPVIVGYSLGGRLALHALLEAPKLFAAAVIVSAGLGIEGAAARRERRERDESWAQRFEHEPWDSVVHDWNAQSVLAGGGALPRQEKEFDRSALATALRLWSPAKHPPLGDRLGEIETPVLWVAGGRDGRYMEEGGKAVARLRQGRLVVAPNTGHRVPWENPQLFGKHLQDFLQPIISR